MTIGWSRDVHLGGEKTIVKQLMIESLVGRGAEAKAIYILRVKCHGNLPQSGGATPLFLLIMLEWIVIAKWGLCAFWYMDSISE
jgi:hypothetical protein